MESMFRIGVFYDGSYTSYAQNYFYYNKHGWFSFVEFHRFLEDYIRKLIQGPFQYKIVHSCWYQGLATSKNTDEHSLRVDRNKHMDLLFAGIVPKYFPMSQENQEKGIDVAMAIDILEYSLAMDTIDLAVLVTGDGDFIPLVRSLMKKSIQVLLVYFEYEYGDNKSFANQRLQDACSYKLNVNSLEKDKNYKAQFGSLFQKFSE